MSSYRVTSSLSLAIVCLLAAAASGFEPIFNTRLDFPVDSFPVSVCSADFDHDGILDLAVANLGDSSMSVLIGNGDRTFKPAVNYGVGGGPYSICTADFENDGWSDLAVANSRSNNISVLRNIGDGTFAPASNLAVGSYPYCVIASDFDGDSWADLAVANFGSNTVSILRNVTHISFPGTPSFLDAVSYAVGTAPYSLCAADFYRNGRQDLAVANYGSNTISLLRNQGVAATFNLKDSIMGLNHPISICASDFDGDGSPDLAVADYFSTRTDTAKVQPPDSVLIFRNKGNGRFDKTDSCAVGFYPSSVVAADFNGDGTPALAVTNYGSHTVSILKYGASPKFTLDSSYFVGNFPSACVAGDLNGDSRIDLAVACTGSGNVAILRNRGSALFDSHGQRYVTATPPLAIRAADINNDAAVDMILTRSAGSDIDLLGRVLIISNNGDGTFRDTTSTNGGSLPYSLCVADFNNDAHQDMAVTNPGVNAISVLRNMGIGRFDDSGVVSYPVGTSPNDVIAGDFNSDGKIDLAVANSGSSSISVLIDTGSGRFSAAVSYTVGTHPNAIRSADFDRDGKLDLAVTHAGTTRLSILRGNGNGTFVATVNDAETGGPTAICVGDFDGDSGPDLAVTNYDSNYVAILKNNGGTFSRVGKVIVGRNPVDIVAINLGDGKVSLAVANFGSDDISILKGNGDGTFAGAAHYGVEYRPNSLAVADFDRDGKEDLAVANRGSSSVTLLFNALQGTTDVRDHPSENLPDAFTLAQNYPNPFNSSTTIAFDLPNSSMVTLEIFDILGRHVATLVNETLSAGHKLVTWDGTDSRARNVASGIYLYRLRTDQRADARKMILLK